MVDVRDVVAYVDENVLRSEAFDNATEKEQLKAVNQAEKILQRVLPDVYKDGVPIEDVAEQALWLLKIDDSVERAEQGATAIKVDGISISYSEMDRTIAPLIMRQNGLRNTRRVRVGSYSLPPQDTFNIQGGGF